jgi:NTP pyrophosphatase (non-canonical NTP hydrolase)
MKLKNEFKPIKDWLKEKNILEKSDIKTQYVKLLEECGELAESILKNDDEAFKDAIGDCVVVLTSLAELKGMSIEECINYAYEIIKKRNGKIINGVFIKSN